MRMFRKSSAAVFVLLILSICCVSHTASAAEAWIGTWATGQQLVETQNNPASPGLANNTLRQIVHASLGGSRIRVQFSNKYSTGATTINSAHIALSNGGIPINSSIDTGTDTALTFGGSASVTIPAGEEIYSDAVDFNVPPLSNLTVSIYFGSDVSSTSVTGHPGSRTGYYLKTGNTVSDAEMESGYKTEHWYVLSRIDVLLNDSYGCVVALGDSITDGRGCNPNYDNRWPDLFAARLNGNPTTSKVGVINQGIGGNCVVSGGLGPTALSRFDHDVIGQPGVKWAIIFEGTNDIGGGQSAANIISAYQTFITNAHSAGLLIYGATITPFKGSGYYSTSHEAVRDAVNDWIRTSGEFDAVIDFDASTWDPADHDYLNPPYRVYPPGDQNDYLHFNADGYQAMVDDINLALFEGSYEEDVWPPEPDPMTWATPPAAAGPSSITMTATTADDNSPPVQYYFECTNYGDANSDWQTNPTYVASGLSPSTLYTFRVKARDSSVAQNETDWSGTESATTDPPDTVPPTPNPMTWLTLPTETGAYSITMTATTATDTCSPPVQYYFECTSDGSKSSSWQASATYSPSGLSPSTLYSFRVKARDSAQALNETGWSSTESATTLPPPTNVEILGGWMTGTSHPNEVNGTNRLLVFIAHEESASGTPTLTSVTYGGQTMTKVIEESAVNGYGNYVAAFILNDAGITAANSDTFTPTWSAATSSVSYASVFLSNVSQTEPNGAEASNGTTSPTPDPISTSALATNNEDMVIEAATCGNNGSYTMELNGFSEGTDELVGSSGHTGATGYKSATGAAETPTADFDGSVNRQVIIGFVVRAGAAADPPPAAPTGLTATAGNETISLDWNDNAEADLDGYNVYRSTTQGSGYGKLNVSLVNDSDYIDGTVTNGIPYYYVVTAEDVNGHESGNSNEATATPAYQTCADVLAGGDGLESDLTGDCYVNYWDLQVMVDNWLRTDCTGPDNCEGADFEPADGTVDFYDYSDFAMQWLLCNDPEDANCGI